MEATVIGKPSKTFFMAALASMNVDPQHVCFILYCLIMSVGMPSVAY